MISTHPRVKAYCSEPLENIENYDKAIADDKHMWDCHHRNEICEANRSRSDGGKTTWRGLIADGMYWHRPASELIFLRRDAHLSLHHKGNPLSLESRRKMSDSNHTKKKVQMKRKSDGFTKVFPSQSEATRWLRDNGCPSATQGKISECCMGKRASIYGAIWSFVS